jgi:hypothetical protein
MDLTGQRFGRLIVKRFAGMNRTGARFYCQCDCGGEAISQGIDLKRGDIRSCGCLVREIAAYNSKTYVFIHGETNQNLTGEYRAWRSMRQRCYNPKCKAFRNYGGRGISVCELWLNSYPAFLADMGRRPSPDHSLDRIDNNGNYEPLGDCRRPKQQSTTETRKGPQT